MVRAISSIMKTITFYSYKGGVGRSLALSNIAVRLSEFGRTVCIVDFDLDAPGLQFKFKDYSHAPIRLGLTDYIYDYFGSQQTKHNIRDFSVQLIHNSRTLPNITLIPAGNMEDPGYWRKLSSLRWADMFYAKEAQGVSFFLELKAKIEKEISPDFLLIDSRTGITDISGITLKLFADQIVLLAVNNKENLFGSRMILQNLLNPSSALVGTAPKVHFALTRLPSDEQENEPELIELVRKELQNPAIEVMMLHSDPKLQVNETQEMAYDYEGGVSLQNDYLRLFDVLTRNELGTDELNKFKDIRKAKKAFLDGQKEPQTLLKIKFFSESIRLDPQNLTYLISRGNLFLLAEKWSEAISDYKQATKISNGSLKIERFIGYCYYNLGDHDKALSYLDLIDESNTVEYLEAAFIKAFIYRANQKLEVAETYIEFILRRNADFDRALNFRANYLLERKDLQKAYQDIFRAINLAPENPVYYATLAEIYATDGKTDEFYVTFAASLKFGLKVGDVVGAKAIYQRFLKEERFIKLMNKYNLDIELLN
jgi:tetratricopeptide (TPR) repeat protein